MDPSILEVIDYVRNVSKKDSIANIPLRISKTSASNLDPLKKNSK